MQHIQQLSQLRAHRQLWREANQRVALVPTLGNLHSGHFKLVRHALTLADKVVVSIYVNPMQFGASEDLDSYPRTLQADMQALAEMGVAAVFTPQTNEMYPHGLKTQTFVEVPGISDLLCGASRPHHFRGVATVVCKLFNMVRPEVAVFGKKDYQQLQVVRNMVADLSMDVDIHGVETEREPSGLAKSSRNGYLSDNDKQTAAVIYSQLQQAVQRIKAGEGEFNVIEAEAKKNLLEAGLEPEYFSIRRCKDLTPAQAEDPKDTLVILVAAKMGSTRLIDNLEVAN